MTIEDQIKAIEDEIQKTQYNKATQHHIGKLKAKMARLKEELQLRQLKSGGGGAGDAPEKRGDAPGGPVGVPRPGENPPPEQNTGARREGGAGALPTRPRMPRPRGDRGAEDSG